MKEKIVVLSAILLSSASISIYAENAILSSLSDSGVTAAQLSDNEMREIKGAALISGQPKPTTTRGLFTYQVSWKGAGSQQDYRSYRIVGNSFDSDIRLKRTEGGKTYDVAGDRWLADRSGNPNQWVASRATEIEYHYQILNGPGGEATDQGLRNTNWNRPISTRSW